MWSHSVCVQTNAGTNLNQFVLLGYAKRIHFQLNRDMCFFPDRGEARMRCCDHQQYSWRGSDLNLTAFAEKPVWNVSLEISPACPRLPLLSIAADGSHSRGSEGAQRSRRLPECLNGDLVFAVGFSNGLRQTKHHFRFSVLFEPLNFFLSI